MEIDIELKEALERQLLDIENKKVLANAQSIIKRYRENNSTGMKLIQTNEEAITYSLYRMPSTYCAIYSALKHSLEMQDCTINNCIDIGAGTGSASWAINNILCIDDITCLENDEIMLNIGKKIMKNTTLENVKWKKFDICTDEICQNADLVVTSYMINELLEEEKEKAILKMWESTNNILLIIEPGTPNGFKNILKARDVLLKNGANILAPCCNNHKCDIDENDWCSFYVRVNRSGIQKKAKKGELGYEDEKFSYIAVSKVKTKMSKERILRHPQINTGFVKVKLCTSNGVEEKIYSKKMGEIYKKIRKLDAGDII